ncbi:tyrosine-type recombinase/integrase [Novosphingobium sp. ERW19]|jgi:integrase|uniref:tyrosine-type recombinase/integrase n=1 Tax=Novosphingobium sp. ERW19 TaxID=2726186 RepID=UPI001F0F9276|nr:tyrosine-type recombinase/integrase [Novosphingobium sp. ERW19]
MGHSDLDPAVHERRPWNAGQNVGPKRPLRPRDIWAIRFYLDEHKRLRDRALFDLAIDSKLRGCDLVKLRTGDLVSGGSILNRATVIQQKTGLPVQFEIMTEARKSLLAWLERRKGSLQDFVFPSRIDYLGHISTRQYARLLDEWVSMIVLDKREYGTHSMRRTKAALIYKATGNLRAIQILPGFFRRSKLPWGPPTEHEPFCQADLHSKPTGTKAVIRARRTSSLNYAKGSQIADQISKNAAS